MRTVYGKHAETNKNEKQNACKITFMFAAIDYLQ